MKIVKMFKRNKLLFIVGLTYLILLFADVEKAKLSLNNSVYYIKEMFQIMPVIFILTSLIEAWVPKKLIINSLGEDSGYKGKILSFALGSFSAGPIYAAFPVCKTLIRKGASLSNIVIILSAWAVIKVPMLVNEAKFLGIEFMLIRWMLTIISILIMGYLVAMFVKRDSIPNLKEIEKSNGIKKISINESYCVGCGICQNIVPDKFVIENRKAKILQSEIKEDEMIKIREAIDRCPVNALSLI